MRRLYVFACLAFAACSVSNDLDSLKGAAGASGRAGQVGADASADAGLCERNVDCKGCIACEDFCNCAAPLSTIDLCIAGCSDGGSTGGASSGGAGGAASGGTSSGGASSGGASSGGTGGASTGGISSGGSAGSGGTGGISYVNCGAMACADSNICCATSKPSYNCVPPAACTEVPVLCEGPSTCKIGETCCVRRTVTDAVIEVVCKNNCSAPDKVACAESPNICSGGETCTQSNIGIVKYCD